MPSPKASNSSEVRGSSLVWGGFLLVILFGAFCAPMKWEIQTAVFFLTAGLLMVAFPSQVRLPRHWWALVLIFAAGAGLAFLPIGIVGANPLWRENLKSLGVAVGDRVVIQAPQALEMAVVFVATLVVGVWLAGQRASSGQLRLWAFLFAGGVAVYSIASQMTRDLEWIVHRTDGHFGFFPNRNHTGTFLAMGIMAGFGSFLQEFRNKKIVLAMLAGAFTVINLIAVAGWSISRGGYLLTGIGLLLWLAAIGPRYLGKNGLRIAVLISLLLAGGYFFSNTRLKSRLEKTSETAVSMVSGNSPESERSAGVDTLDFRIPVALDALDLIKDYPLTGIGAGQFAAVFPQYRARTIGVNHHIILHPENDWLWLLSELGAPACVAMIVLVVSALWISFRGARSGRDRSLRMACLVGALLVPMHGLFDVPGHRIALAWAAAFLFALSLQPAGEDRGITPLPKRWIGRLCGVGILSIGAGFAWGLWLGGPSSANGLADSRYEEAVSRYQDAVPSNGNLTISKVPELSRAIELAEQATAIAPLDYRAYGLVGRGDLFFDDRRAQVRKAFAIENALNPYWAKIPFLQGMEWAAVDPTLAIDSWREGLRRADAGDRIDPHYHQRREMARELTKLGRLNPSMKVATDRAQSE